MQAPASSVFLLRVEFKSSSIKKSEYRVEYRVVIAVVDSIILDVIIISDQSTERRRPERSRR